MKTLKTFIVRIDNGLPLRFLFYYFFVSVACFVLNCEHYGALARYQVALLSSGKHSSITRFRAVFGSHTYDGTYRYCLGLEHSFLRQ